MAFTGFSDETVKFFRALNRNNNREWFHKNKHRYDEYVMAPAKEFVTTIAPFLYEISPDINAEPRVNAAIRRINRDIRFSPDKTPYKTYQDFKFLQGRDKEGAGFYMHCSAKGITMAGGVYRFDKTRLARYRAAVDDAASGRALEAAVRDVRKAGYEIGGSHYKRVPRGFDPEHERADLLKHAGLYAWKDVGMPKEFQTKAFPRFCARHFKRMSPINLWAVEYVGV